VDRRWSSKIHSGGSNAHRHRLQGPRTVELKRALVCGITVAFVDSLGVPADSVQVWTQETPADSWGQGGALTADKG
jgi:4-oxalocrotonate tautomerase